MSSPEVRAHSCVHVLKGAVVKVLGQRYTASVRTSAGKGVLTVQMERRPTPEELSKVWEEANAKVSEGAELIEFVMERREAEGHWGKALYDLFPVPEGAGMLRIVRIEGWEVNCCMEDHVESTRAIGRIEAQHVRFRESKKLLELRFRLA
jgi:alanyl-tRNA synthetase